MALAMAPWNLRLCGAAVFGALMLGAKFRYVPLDAGDKVLAAFVVRASMGSTEPCADPVLWTGLQETFMVIAKVAARDDYLATALTLASARPMILTKRKLAAIL